MEMALTSVLFFFSSLKSYMNISNIVEGILLFIYSFFSNWNRSQLSEKLLAGEANYVRDGLTSHVLISQAGMSTTGHDVSAKGMDCVLTSMFIRILENFVTF